jgi:hypothetical protein
VKKTLLLVALMLPLMATAAQRVMVNEAFTTVVG